MKRLIILIVACITFLIIAPNAIQHNLSVQTPDSLSLNSPSSCPTSGCAAGQRLNFDVTYAVAPANAGPNPNVQICLYVPSSGGIGSILWADVNSYSMSLYGKNTNILYTTGETDAKVCTDNLPVNDSFLGGAYTILPLGTTSDGLSFVFRVNRSANLNGTVMAKIFQGEANGITWNLTSQPSLNIDVDPASTNSFAANDPASCGTYAPCYVNSGDDKIGGIGTGLKDAVDAQINPATINILGNYLIKSNSIDISFPHVIQGENGATITYSGSLCNQPMLSVSSGATLSHLNINGGKCLSPRRDLISINSTSLVTIESNTLTGGKDAISIIDNIGDILIRFNQIQGNSGYGIFRAPGTQAGLVDAVANNIFGNRTGYQSECSDKGQVDHNFWGSGISTSSTVSHCSVSNGKRLGAAISLASTLTGVDAELLTVTANKTSAFNQKIAFQHSNNENDFGLYVANHSYGKSENIPFLGYGTTPLIPCSNFYDIFLDNNSSIPNSLIASFKYDLNPICTAMIESSDYCGQIGNPAKYPLWWFDPSNNTTNSWNTTGQNPDGPGADGSNGQVTICSTNTKEISVTIDSSGRPDFTDDLLFLPMVVGIPANITLTNFTATPSISQVSIQWNTSSEVNITGFYVTRSVTIDGSYSRTSNLIPAKGNAFIGGIYTFIDTNLSFGTNYYYKLEVIAINNQTIAYYGPVSALTATATPTFTPTPTSTFTSTTTPTKTITPTSTITLTRTITRTFTPTTIPTNTPTYYYYYYRSPTPIYTASPILTNTSAFNTDETATLEIIDTLSPTITSVEFTPGPDEGYPGNTTQTSENPETDQTQFSENETATFIQSSVYPPPESTQISGNNPTISPPDKGNKGIISSLLLGTGNIAFWILGLTASVFTLILVIITGWFLFKNRVS